jgi:hypothetical protein
VRSCHSWEIQGGPVTQDWLSAHCLLQSLGQQLVWLWGAAAATASAKKPAAPNTI